MLGAIPFVLAAIYGRSVPLIFGGLFLAEGVMFMNVVPCYTIISNVVMPNMRAVACAVALAAVHLLGDIWSPTLMGWVVDTFGTPTRWPPASARRWPRWERCPWSSPAATRRT